LLFIQHAKEEHNGRLQFGGHSLCASQTAGQLRLGFKYSPGQQLTLAPKWINRTVQIPSAHGLAGNPFTLRQLQ
jgi:hypothetical protein